MTGWLTPAELTLFAQAFATTLAISAAGILLAVFLAMPLAVALRSRSAFPALPGAPLHRVHAWRAARDPPVSPVTRRPSVACSCPTPLASSGSDSTASRLLRRDLPAGWAACHGRSRGCTPPRPQSLAMFPKHLRHPGRAALHRPGDRTGDRARQGIGGALDHHQSVS